MDLIYVVFKIDVNLSHIVAIVGMAVNAFLAYWIVRTIQRRMTDRRVLKDHFIDEVKEVRDMYKKKLIKIYAGECNSKHLTPWFKLMNIKVDNLMALINDKYNIKTDYLSAYQIDLRFLIIESDDMRRSYRGGDKLTVSSELKTDIIRFQQTNSCRFNELIVEINDAT
jgi:hypothetical protein